MRRHPVVVIALLAMAACSAYRPITRPPLPRDEVQLTFLSPRNLVGRTESGSSRRLENVTVIRGRIATMAPDTMHLFVASARGPEGEISGVPTDLIVAVPRDWYPTVQERHLSKTPLKTAGYVALGVLAAAVLLLALALGSAGGGGY
jgi:hypothetical protein